MIICIFSTPPTFHQPNTLSFLILGTQSYYHMKMLLHNSIYLKCYNVQESISITYFIDYNSQSFCSCVNRKVSDTICSFYCTSRIGFSQLNYQNQTFFIVSSKLLSELLLKAKQENKNHHHLCDQPAENA